MFYDLIDILGCPNCKGSSLVISNKEVTHKDVKRAELLCNKCGATYLIEDGIPKLLPKFINSALESRNKSITKWSRKLNKLQKWRKSYKKNLSFETTEHRRDKLYKQSLDFIGFISLNDLVLDIGCGQGVLKTLTGTDLNYIGLEPLIEHNELCNFNLVQGVGEYLPFRNNTISECFFYQTLDHSIDAARMVQEAFRVLKPNGYLNILQIILPNPKISFSFDVINNIRNVRNYLFQDVGIRSKTHFFTVGKIVDIVCEQFSTVNVHKLENNQVFIRANSKAKRPR